MNELYPANPTITLFDPLAELLGAGDGKFTYTFIDAVKLSGHACPTVAGAFLTAVHGINALYDEAPVRGQIIVTMPGSADSGVNGPISQVLTLITGAAAENGFHGLNGRHIRSGLMTFSGDPSRTIRFTRADTHQAVDIGYDASTIPASPEMNPLMQQIMQGKADDAAQQEFRRLWRERVVAILEDNGKSTLTISPL